MADEKTYLVVNYASLQLIEPLLFCIINYFIVQQSIILPNAVLNRYQQGILKGTYDCTVDLLFDWFGISCMTTDNFCFYLQNRLIQTSQTGGQWYSDTSPFSIPWVPITWPAAVIHLPEVQGSSPAPSLAKTWVQVT